MKTASYRNYQLDDRATMKLDNLPFPLLTYMVIHILITYYSQHAVWIY